MQPSAVSGHNGTKFLCRAADHDDLLPLLRLIHLAFAHQGVETDPPSAALQETRESLAAHIDRGGGALLIEGPKAALLWQRKNAGFYISRLAVHPAWRRRGLAQQLIMAAEDLARSFDLPRLYLSTRLALRDNRRLFAACGYRETALHTHAGYDAPTYLEMEKILTADV